MDFPDLLEINRKELFRKINKIKVRFGGVRKCDDVIKALSSSVVSDKRLINGYTKAEVKLIGIQGKSGLRICRAFTNKGIRRYIHEGKIIDYQNACAYFGEKPLDKELEKVRKYLGNDSKFNTRQILKWAYEKRKQDKTLGVRISCEELIEYLVDDEFEDQEKIDMLKKLGNVAK